ncbi:hypothetical protein ES288_D13G170500v1 [Gossypium darwinii]|uniref:Uncharacterized protein n=1 Tax=Gossypium darwinii TaxID=34276 RepID=A0A5D1ZYV1_GOSDA|nr:hypothetical protein ES288_D13G170500v1 [Gossypium darwinii]
MSKIIMSYSLYALPNPLPVLAHAVTGYSNHNSVDGAKEVKSSDEKLSTYYALHARYENCLVLYIMFSSRKTEPGNMWKNPTYPFLSLLSMDVCVN